MKGLLFFTISFFSTRAIFPLGYLGLKKLNINRKNFKGKSLPIPGGLIPISVYLLLLLLTRLLTKDVSLLLILIFSSLTILGLLDDIFGEGNEKGFKGHFKTLLKGKITTGVMKAMGISLLALVGIQNLGRGKISLLGLFLDIGLIALTSNFINLLDLRPGRSIKAFLILGIAINLVIQQTEILWFYILTGAFLAYLPWDLGEKTMLGDTGANVLGFSLGLLMAIYLTLPLKIVIIFFLFILHSYAESISFSKIIAENSYLRYLDLLGRSR
ncbi:MAG: UDP-N-acetylmuramyl pentapeptide phosphotransferase [Bacillota bacterium]